MATTKQKLSWGLGAVLVLAVFGSCINDDGPSTNSIAAPTTSAQASPTTSAQASPTTSAQASPTTTSAIPIPVRKRVEWEGTVLDYDAAGSGAGLYIDVDGERTRVDISHVGAVTCGGYTASDSNRAVVRQRLTELAPIGTAVRVVRSMPLTPGGYVYIAGPVETITTNTATATEPTTTAGSTTASTTASASTTTTTTEKASLSATTTATPSTANTSTDTEILLNEVLLAEGLGTLDMPGINLSVLSTTSLDQQLAAAHQSNTAAPNSLRWPALFTAYQNAWDNRIGLQAQCRADDDTAIIKAEQRTELDRLRAGPDGVLYTSDDDRTTYKFDDNGNIYADTPTYNNSGGGGSGGGGGGGFCRSRWR
ncbi:hypothetical protein [Rhodococcus qingshengii]|uniref:hypothetical protein n=1 Tax=Rhodococcus qingshengii TaxID=334542 RepID=UPI001ABF25F0|nr:hypothetical protein [Rhodococcus qingshengii]